MDNWDYGDAYLRHPIQTGAAVFSDGSTLMVHDIHHPLPLFMRDADLIFVDPPWNQGNYSSFYSKAQVPAPISEYAMFHHRLFECLQEIGPQVCYIEIGKEWLPQTVIAMRQIYPKVTFYNSTYYHRSGNLCYIVRGSKKGRPPKLDGMDEESVISWVCQNEDYQCVGDLCMGRGLVALGAFHTKRRFVGTEMNHKRLSVALERLVRSGAQYTIVENPTNCKLFT